MTSQSLPQPQQTPEQLRWQSDYIQEYYYMVDGNRHSFSSFMGDMLEYPDFTVRHETQTYIFCPQCYEEEGINAI